jgi:chromosome segregation ATPase
MNNMDLLRQQLDLNSDLMSKLERMEIQSEKNHFELCDLNSTNAELNAALKAMSCKMEERGTKLMDISNERDRLSRLLANRDEVLAVANSDMNRSLADNKTLREDLKRKTEELIDANCNITGGNLLLKEQKVNFEDIISNVKPELEAYKALNERLNIDIAAAGKSVLEQRKEADSLKKHISDLTAALDGFAGKFNNESDLKKIATQKLHEKSIAMIELEEENQRLCLLIEELRGEYENQESVLESRQIDKEWLSSELSRVTDEKNVLKGENEYLKNELESVQCILADQLQLRLQDRSDYEALLVASAEDVQHAIDDSNDRLEVNSSHFHTIVSDTLSFDLYLRSIIDLYI